MIRAPLLLSLCLVQPAVTWARDPEVISDSPAYCEELIGRFHGLTRAAPPPVEVMALSVEGRRMCGSGLTRAGVMRLRRAIALLRHPDE